MEAKDAGTRAETTGKTVDGLGRPLHDLRISLTDRCNFRCRYCMPKELFGPDFQFLPHDELLTFAEITRLAKLFVRAGVRKIRLTGGEPLLRKNVEDLIDMLSHIEGVEDIAMTTNGALLSADRAKSLRSAGLKRITISLDSLADEVFMAMNDVGFPVAKVLNAIAAAESAGLYPVKVNMVVKRGFNEDSIESMAEYFRGTRHILRFIEYMDVGNSNGWRMEDVVPAAEILDRIHAKWPIQTVTPKYPGEVANRYIYQDGQGEIGVIASVTHPFCGGCSRARLGPEGQLYTCLFGSRGYDLKQLLRSGQSDDDIWDAISSIWYHRVDRYSEIRSKSTPGIRKVEMSHIGG